MKQNRNKTKNKMFIFVLKLLLIHVMCFDDLYSLPKIYHKILFLFIYILQNMYTLTHVFYILQCYQNLQLTYYNIVNDKKAYFDYLVLFYPDEEEDDLPFKAAAAGKEIADCKEADRSLKAFSNDDNSAVPGVSENKTAEDAEPPSDVAVAKRVDGAAEVERANGAARVERADKVEGGERAKEVSEVENAEIKDISNPTNKIEDIQGENNQ